MEWIDGIFIPKSGGIVSLFFMIIAKWVENKEKLFSVTFNMINII